MEELLNDGWTFELWVTFLIMGELLNYGWTFELCVNVLNYVWTFDNLSHKGLAEGQKGLGLRKKPSAGARCKPA